MPYYFGKDSLIMDNDIQDIRFGIESGKRSQDHTLYLQNSTLKQYIFSKYNPREDALSMLGSDRGNKETTWILFGFGFGYMTQELLEKVSDSIKIIIIEPNPILLEEQIRISRTEWMKDKGNIQFFSGYDFLNLNRLVSQILPEAEVHNIKIVYIKKYIQFYNKYYKSVIEAIDDVVVGKLININTLAKYGETFMENILRNREAIKAGYDLSIYKDIYKGLPGLIVSGGPSLDKNIKYIKDFKGIIFTGGRTLTPILEQDTRPDFLVSIDPSKNIYETLMGNAENDIPLITTDKSNAKVIATHRGKQYFLGTDKIVEELLGISLEGILDRGGSVATLCLSAAHYMGCNPIIFIGQDLANTDMKQHANICSNEKNGLEISNDIKGEGHINTSIYKKIKGYYGDEVYSSPTLISFLRWIEKFIEKTNETLYINATEGGAFIHGTVNQTFKDVVERYAQTSKPNIEHRERQPNIDVDIEGYLMIALEELKEIKVLAKKAKKVAEKLKFEYIKYKGKRLSEVQNLIDQMDEIDKKLTQKGKVKHIVGELFSNAYYLVGIKEEQKEGIKEDKVDKGIRVANHSYGLYEALVKSIEDTINIITNNINN